MKIEVSTTMYKFSHGKLLRGRGNWAFVFIVNGEKEIHFVDGKRLFGDAKKWAQQKAEKLSASAVSVAV